jgi:hypothetical protein
MQQTQPLNQVHEDQCKGLTGEYCETIFSTASAIFRVKLRMFNEVSSRRFWFPSYVENII